MELNDIVDKLILYQERKYGTKALLINGIRIPKYKKENNNEKVS